MRYRDAANMVVESRVPTTRKLKGLVSVTSSAIEKINKDVGFIQGEVTKFDVINEVAKRIMKGDAGEKGDPGERGEKGDAGPQGVPGKDGKDGKNGKPGVDGQDGKNGVDGLSGKDGKDGKDGEDGKDGVSVVDADVAADSHLVFTLSNGDVIDAGPLPEPQASSMLIQGSGVVGAADALNSATTTINVSSATAPTTGQVLMATSSTAATWQTVAGTGDVVGPASSTNNSLARFDGTTGKLLKDGAVIGTDVQAYDADTAKLDVAQSWTAQQTFKELKDTVHTISDGAAFEIDPANGSIQTVTLGANRTPAATNFEAGQIVLLGIDDGTAYTVTWSTVAVTWITPGGTASAPTLATSGYTWVLLWKVGSTMYGAEVGQP